MARDIYANFIPSLGGRYLSSNVNISVPGYGSVPFGSQYCTLVTKNHRRKITAFGVLYEFDRADKGLIVQSPKVMIEQDWWKKILKEQETDVFLLGSWASGFVEPPISH